LPHCENPALGSATQSNRGRLAHSAQRIVIARFRAWGGSKNLAGLHNGG
jgi:hypothetical protein